MLFNVLFATSAILTTFAASPNNEKSPLITNDVLLNTCDVTARVRAEDLSPNAIASGELRIKVNRDCAEKVASVSLALQLDEFSEVKYLKEGVTLPTPPRDGNESSHSYLWSDMDIFGDCGDPNLNKYHESLRDPALWVCKAEERTAFKSTMTLIEKPFDYSQPVIVPFMVAVPNVNYPPGVAISGSYHHDKLRRADSRHAYRYTALITFESGRKVEIPAGYTTFHPMHTALPPAKAFASNVTFEESTDYPRDQLDKCAADTEETVFGAHVTLEGGNVVRTGDTLKGRIAIHRLTDGSTIAKDVSIEVSSERDDLWAQAQAVSGNDVEAFLSGSVSSVTSYDREISTSNCQYGYVLGDEGRCDRFGELAYHHGILTEEKQYLDFELKVSEDAIQNFRAHYATFETSLDITLAVAYPLSVQRCVLSDDDEEPVEHTNQYEEGIWNENTPIGEPHEARGGMGIHTLVAKISLTLIGAQQCDSGRLSSPPLVHYLTPGATSPLILAAPPSSSEDIIFPLSQPIIIPEPVENTTPRLLSPQGRFLEPLLGFPDPTRHYSSGPYAGLLWQKKIMSEGMMRTVIPMEDEAEAQRFYGLSEFQVGL